LYTGEINLEQVLQDVAITIVTAGLVVGGSRTVGAARNYFRPVTTIGDRLAPYQATTAPRPTTATNAADDLLGQARLFRDELADQVGSRVATVTGGYNSTTGRVVAGCSGPGFCAEDDVLRQLLELGSDPANVRFTEAIRPRTGFEVPVCVVCQAEYLPDQFPPYVISQPGGKWGY